MKTQNTPDVTDQPAAPNSDSVQRACSDSGRVMIVDEARVNYFARKFYPHLTPTYGRLCILESLRANLSPNNALSQSPENEPQKKP